MKLTDKTALITGSSRGIGRAAAILFADAGARVAVHYHSDREAAEKTLSSLQGSGHILVQGNVADPAAAASLVEETVEGLGGLQILVNNAGIAPAHPLPEVSYDEWQRAWHETLSANLVGPANLCFHAGHHMMRQGGGRIVNVSSRGAFRGEPDAPAYGASKAGLNALSQSLAKSLAPHGVFVYVVAPGWVDTDMAAQWLQGEAGDEARQQSPLNRVARPEEVARTILFLASEGTDFLTGCIVDVNGASYLRT